MFRHLAGAVRDSEFKDVLCNIHGNRHMLHFRTPPGYWLNETVFDFGTSMPFKSREESIPSLQRTIGPGILVKERPVEAARRSTALLSGSNGGCSLYVGGNYDDH